MFDLVIRSILAGDAKRCPRYCGEPFRTDFLFAIQAQPKRLFVDAANCGSHIVKQA